LCSDGVQTVRLINKWRLTGIAFRLKLTSIKDDCHGQRILVVENEKLLRETRVMLAESEGYSVISVSSDDDALSLLETERFELIAICRNTELHVGLDERLRAMYPTLLTLKIDYLTNRYPQRFSP
jgi:hypothetical protein